MTIQEIMQLAQAGFTADQITALAPLLAGQPQPPAPAAASAPAAAPAPAPAAAEHTDPIMAQLAALTAALQQSNINNSNNNTAQLTPEQVAAQILDPRKKEV